MTNWAMERAQALANQLPMDYLGAGSGRGYAKSVERTALQDIAAALIAARREGMLEAKELSVVVGTGLSAGLLPPASQCCLQHGRAIATAIQALIDRERVALFPTGSAE